MNGNAFEVQNAFMSSALGEKTDLFTEVTIPSIEISGNYCLPFKQQGNLFPYLSTALNDSVMNLSLGITIPEDIHLYVHLSDAYRVMTNVYIDGKEYSTLDTYPSNGEILDLGNLKKGQKVSLLVYTLASPGVKGETMINFYSLDDVLMQTSLTQLRAQKLEVSRLDDTRIEGHISAKEDGILYTSIPYYKGFQIYVDGKRESVFPIGNALIGIEVQAGEHDIYITYFPYGLKAGIICSILGLLCTAFIIRLNTRKLQIIKEGKIRVEN